MSAPDPNYPGCRNGITKVDILKLSLNGQELDVLKIKNHWLSINASVQFITPSYFHLIIVNYRLSWLTLQKLKWSRMMIKRFMEEKIISRQWHLDSTKIFVFCYFVFLKKKLCQIWRDEVSGVSPWIHYCPN